MTCCLGARTELRYKSFGHARVYRCQCQTCGRAVGPTIPPRKVADVAAVPPWNLGLRHSCPRPRGNSKRREYESYLQSPEWKAKRVAVLIRDNWTCRLCGNPATDVHHKTYARFTHEELDDLVSLCADCHAPRGAL